MNENPMYGVGRLSALANQQVTPKNGVEKQVSPTGEPQVPTSWVKPLMAIYVALAGLAGYLALLENNEVAKKVGVVLGGVLAVLGPLLGIASPGWRRNGTAVAILLCLGLGSHALAEERVLIEPGRPSLMGAEAPKAADFVSWGFGIGVDYRAHRGAVPVVEAMGLVGLLRLWEAGPVFSLALGGSMLAADGDPRAGAFLGGAFDLPGVGAPVKPALYVGAGYDGGWSFRGGFEFRFSQ